MNQSCEQLNVVSNLLGDECASSLVAACNISRQSDDWTARAGLIAVRLAQVSPWSVLPAKPHSGPIEMVTDGGSFTLTSGILSRMPMQGKRSNQPGQCSPRRLWTRRRIGASTWPAHQCDCPGVVGRRHNSLVRQRDSVAHCNGRKRK
jgi:hypothetical protein